MGLSQRFAPVGQQHDALLAFLKEARSTEPVFYWEPHDVWVVTRYDDVHTVLNDAVHFSNDGNLAVMNNRYCPQAQAILSGGIDWNRVQQVNGAEGETHRRLRSVMQAILTPRRFAAMQPAVRANVNRLIDGFIRDGQTDFVASFAYPLPVYVIFDVIGFNAGEVDLVSMREWSDDMFRLWLLPMPAEEQVRCAGNAVRFQDAIRAMMHDRRRAPRDDLLTEFVRQIDDGTSRISEDEVTIMFPMNLIGAGHETTKAALSNAFYHLLSRPERWAALCADPASIPKVVDETLRFDGSVFAWYRTVIEPTEIAGTALPAGSKIVAVMGSANHDETKFDRAEDFCPARGNRPPHLTFSVGRHFCLGAPLARMEMQVALEEFARRLPGLRLASPGPADYDPSFATRVIRSLPIAWDMTGEAGATGTAMAAAGSA